MAYDTATGTGKDAWMVTSPFTYFFARKTGVVEKPGAVGQKTEEIAQKTSTYVDEKTCAGRQGRWDPEKQECLEGSWCNFLPTPLDKACDHPYLTAGLVLGVATLPWTLPWFIKLIRGSQKALAS